MEIVMKGEIITMKKKLALLLALVMVCISVLAGCGGGSSSSADKPLVVGYSNFSSKFSPFFAETAYDQDVATVTQVVLLGLDRPVSTTEPAITMMDRLILLLQRTLTER